MSATRRSFPSQPSKSKRARRREQAALRREKQLMRTTNDIQARLREMELNDWHAYLGELRLLDSGDPHTETEVFARDEPGYPLGPGMPLGGTLRRDGESHRMAWMRVLRQDPCAFCGKLGDGTVDHIEPQSKPVRGIGGAHTWANFTGACASCNNRKQNVSLLAFMGRRVGMVFTPKVTKQYAKAA